VPKELRARRVTREQYVAAPRQLTAAPLAAAAVAGGGGRLGQQGGRYRYSLVRGRPAGLPAGAGGRVVLVAAGEAHSGCVTAAGELYLWGRGDHGRLAHGGTRRCPSLELPPHFD
jgi:hypothetical protein